MAAFGAMRLEIRACVAYDSGLCNGPSKKNAQDSRQMHAYGENLVFR
jgi:hypothetical protein